MTESELVGLGGAIGVVARVGLGVLIARSLSFPYGAIVTNVATPSLLVFSLHLLLKSSLAPELRVAITTGLLAGFMLLATFNRETLKLISDGARVKCLLVMGSAGLGCLIAGGLGLGLARGIA